MRYWFPFPLLSLSLLAFWLLANQSTSPGAIVLGAVLAISLAWAMTNLTPHKSRLRRIGAAIRLFATLAADIAASNWAVFKTLVRRRQPLVTPAFVTLRLTLEDENAIALLSIFLTTAPGTAWIEYDRRTHLLLIHVLDTADGKDWQHIVTNRYERLLKEIFE